MHEHDHPIRVDAHQHFWKVGRFQYPWMAGGILQRDYLPGDLRPYLDRVGIDCTVFVQATHDVEETAWALDLAREHPWIAGVVGWLDLQSPRLEEQIARFKPNPKFVGVRHMVQDEPDDAWLLQDNVVDGLKTLARSGLRYDLLLHPRHLQHIPRLADRVPELAMIVDHLAKPPIASGGLEPWRKDLGAVARIPGVHCKLSGMITEADHKNWRAADLRPYIETVFELFGPSRLVFGSDWPVCQLAGGYSDVLAVAESAVGGLSAADRAAIFGGNAGRFYALKGA